MKEIKFEIMMEIEDDFAEEAKRWEHHAEELLDLGSYTEIKNVYGCKITANEKYIDRKRKNEMKEVDKAVELLRPLFEGLAEGRCDNVDVYTEDYHDEDYIIVVIDKAKYEINVTAENVRSIVQSVVNRVALKL
ncbi:hypothetical protein [Eubacterium ventriosum]